MASKKTELIAFRAHELQRRKLERLAEETEQSMSQVLCLLLDRATHSQITIGGSHSQGYGEVEYEHP